MQPLESEPGAVHRSGVHEEHAGAHKERVSGHADVEHVINRLRRVEGQVRGLQKMIEEGKDCEAVLTQLSAVRAALDRVGMFVISHRMKECLEGAGESLDPGAIEAALEVFLKYASCGR